MRKLFLFAAAFAAACGSDSNGGGVPSGTVGNQGFTPREARAIVAGTGSTPCQLTLGGFTLPVAVKAFALQFTSYADACGDFDFSGGTCPVHRSAQSVTVIFARLNPGINDPNPAEPALTAGTYTLFASPTDTDLETGGTRYAAFAQATATDASCAGTPSLSVRGGTLRLDQVSGPITGNLNVTFQDGSTFRGDFSAPVCSGLSLQVCSLAASGGALCAGTPGACAP